MINLQHNKFPILQKLLSYIQPKDQESAVNRFNSNEIVSNNSGWYLFQDTPQQWAINLMELLCLKINSEQKNVDFIHISPRNSHLDTYDSKGGGGGASNIPFNKLKKTVKGSNVFHQLSLFSPPKDSSDDGDLAEYCDYSFEKFEESVRSIINYLTDLEEKEEKEEKREIILLFPAIDELLFLGVSSEDIYLLVHSLMIRSSSTTLSSGGKWKILIHLATNYNSDNNNEITNSTKNRKGIIDEELLLLFKYLYSGSNLILEFKKLLSFPQPNEHCELLLRRGPKAMSDQIQNQSLII